MNKHHHYTIFSTFPHRHLSFNTHKYYFMYYIIQRSTLEIKYFGATSRERTDSTMHYVASSSSIAPYQASCPQAVTHLTWHAHKALWLAAFIIPHHKAEHSVQTPPTCSVATAIKSVLGSLVSYCTRCGLQTRVPLDTSQTRRPDKNREVAVMMCKYAGLRRYGAYSC